jgi:hypothetical protein
VCFGRPSVPFTLNVKVMSRSVYSCFPNVLIVSLPQLVARAPALLSNLTELYMNALGHAEANASHNPNRTPQPTPLPLGALKVRLSSIFALPWTDELRTPQCQTFPSLLFHSHLRTKIHPVTRFNVDSHVLVLAMQCISCFSHSTAVAGNGQKRTSPPRLQGYRSNFISDYC